MGKDSFSLVAFPFTQWAVYRPVSCNTEVKRIEVEKETLVTGNGGGVENLYGKRQGLDRLRQSNFTISLLNFRNENSIFTHELCLLLYC